MEGQGPRTKAKKEELKKETAGIVVEEGVWMAAVNDSDDENMADDEFNNFVISEDNMFFSEEKDEEEIEKLTRQLKKQLEIKELFKHFYPYDNPDYMLNTQNFTDSSDNDDNTGAAAAMVESESENKVEIDPY